MARERSNDVLDTRLHKALSHPVRARVLSVLWRGEASPAEIARQLDLPIVNVSHHVKVLRELEVIEQVAFRHVRGAVEHRYRAARRPWVRSTALELDEQGWQALQAKIDGVLEAALAEQRAARERIAAGRCGGPPVRGQVTLFLYDAGDAPDAAA